MGTTFLIHDSMRGYGTAQLSGGGHAQDVAGDKWFWPDAAIDWTLNNIFSLAGVRESFVSLGFPDNDVNAASSVTTLINNGTIRSGDAIVIMGAGDVSGTAQDVETMYSDLFDACAQTGITVIPTTTVDTSNSSWQAIIVPFSNPAVSMYGSPASNSRWDTLLSGSPQKTPNNCIRAAATTHSLTVRESAADILSFAQAMNGQTGMICMHNTDWIHYTFFSQLRMARNVAVARGLTITQASILRVRERVQAHWQDLNYNHASLGPEFWSQTLADRAAHYALLNSYP